MSIFGHGTAQLQVENDDKMKLDPIRWGAAGRGDYRVLFHIYGVCKCLLWHMGFWSRLVTHIIDGAKGFVRTYKYLGYISCSSGVVYFVVVCIYCLLTRWGGGVVKHNLSMGG